MQLLKPTLYAGDGANRPARLCIAACRDCGTVNFPATVPGCKSCGASSESLEPREHDGSGRLLAFVTLHEPLAPGVEAPCIIGEVDFGDGVVEEIVLDTASEEGLQIGAGGRLVLLPVERDGAAVLTARFRLFDMGALLHG